VNSINFPTIFSGTRTLLKEDSAATLQNIHLLLESCKGELFGDPEFGAKLKRYIYEQNNFILRDIIIDELLVCLQNYIPQIGVSRKGITLESNGVSIIATINCINRLDGTSNLYQISLTDE
jgi:phage baseplate assembly protein W